MDTKGLKWVRQELRRRRWTAYRLAVEAAPLGKSTVYRFLRGGRVNPMTEARIREALR